MTYNRKEIMIAAWADFNKRNADYEARGMKRRDPFKNCLALAWSRARANEIRRIEHEKSEVIRIENERRKQEHKNWLAESFSNTEIGRLEKQLFYLEMKDRWNEKDHDLAREIQDKINSLKSGFAA